MASTASSAPEAAPCVVCGTATSSYCSACRQAGTLLAFCSKEHQKLVWKHHKLVCGPASNPFKWPQPSAQELAVIKSVAHKRFEQPFQRAGGHTLAEELEGVNGMQGGAWETVLIPDYEDLDFHSVPVQGVLITHLRGEFYRAAQRLLLRGERVLTSVWDHAAYWYRTLFLTLHPSVDPPEPLLQQWRHRAVVLASLLDSRPSGPSSPDKPHDRAIAHALAAMWESVAPCVPTDKGTTATELAKKLQTDVAKQVRTNQVITRDADGKPVKSVVTVVRETAVPLFGTTLSFKVE
ncbi:hypothetical protein JCM10449v2_003543 [Rhodotorula kratochvilovae]